MVSQEITKHGRSAIVAVMGATATGKSGLAVDIARRFGGEVVSMDSRQVYRHMDIGTGKATTEEQGGVAHHLLDILDPDQAHSAGRHAAMATACIEAITGRGRLPILAGGTGLYFEATFRPLVDVGIAPDRLGDIRGSFDNRPTRDLFEELSRIDPARAQDLSRNDRVRIARALEIYRATGRPMSEWLAEQGKPDFPYRACRIVLTHSRPILRRRIAERTRALFDAGWIDEVRSLIAAGYGVECPGMRSLGYATIAASLSDLEPAGVLNAVTIQTQQYAKRQETFFRRDPDNVWVDAGRPCAVDEVSRLVEAYRAPE